MVKKCSLAVCTWHFYRTSLVNTWINQKNYMCCKEPPNTSILISHICKSNLSHIFYGSLFASPSAGKTYQPLAACQHAGAIEVGDEVQAHRADPERVQYTEGLGNAQGSV